MNRLMFNVISVITSVITVFTLSGCDKTPEPHQPPSSAVVKPFPYSEIGLSVVVTGYRESGGKFVLQSGDDLEQGDGFSIQVSVQQSGHLYIIHQTTEGVIKVLYPQKERPLTKNDSYVKGGTTISLPENNSSYILDNNLGLEALTIIAAKDLPERFVQGMNNRRLHRYHFDDLRDPFTSNCQGCIVKREFYHL